MKRISDLERAYVREVLDSEFRTSAGGVMTGRLERKFAEQFDCKYAISFVNGTATMHAALAAAGVGKGDEVIVPPLTMASTAFCVLHANALPVFADIDPLTWTISAQSVERCVTTRTKAIIPVSIYGLAPDMDAIMAVAAEHDLFVLEDDAECFLGYYKGRVVGSIGHAASFSFQSSKQMTAGEGGMVTTNDEKLALAIRRFNSLGYAAVGAGKGTITRETIQDPNYARHASIGFNYRMPELCAAVALGQLERLRELIDMRIRVASLYRDAAEGCSWLVAQAVPDGYVHSYWTYVLKLDSDDRISWHDVRGKYLESGGDGIYGAWRLNYLEPAFRGARLAPHQTQAFEPGLCPVAEALQPRLLQFKTNYYDLDEASRAAEALRRTIDSL
jgi:perosamine synthetase